MYYDVVNKEPHFSGNEDFTWATGTCKYSWDT